MLRYVAAVTHSVKAGHTIRRLGRDTSGVTTIEYGLIAGAIAVVIIAAVVLLGGNISDLFNTVAGSIGGSGIAAPATP
ncbi:MAG: Flp family type IVb pilin [Alphaproteobacteria bacterium]|nr:Flp family type IVb pilin [Alphaproteobacteria bacterium]